MTGMLNNKAAGTELYEIEFTPKGTKGKTTVYVWARNQMDASNYLILNHIWGKQHSVKACSSSLMK